MATPNLYGSLLCLHRGPVPEAFEGVAMGLTDAPLTEAATFSERAVIQALSTYRPDRILSSDLPRTRPTAERLAEATGAPLGIREELRPQDLGSFTGRAWSDLALEEAEALQAFLSDPSAVAAPGGESFPRMAERVVRTIEEESTRWHRRVICYVGHAGPIRALIAHALGLEPHQVQRLSFDPFGLSIITWKGPGTTLDRLNEPLT